MFLCCQLLSTFVLLVFEESLRRFAEIPFVTTDKHEFKIEQYEHVLTANMGRGAKLSRHLRVHSYHHLFLCVHQHVSFLSLVMDPLLEAITQNGSTYVDDPLLWHLWEVNVVWKVVGDIGLVADEFKDPLEGKVLILRNI